MVTLNQLKDLYPDNWHIIVRKYKEKRNYTCEECGKQLPKNSKWLHVHHIVPLSKGGSSEDCNLQLLCYQCHKRKHPHMGKSIQGNSKKFSKKFE